MSWALRGTVFIACNCDWGCPCNVNARPTQGHCDGGWTWHVESGWFGETALDGLSFSLFAAWPGALHEGDGKAVSFVDERADDDQRAAITSLLLGEEGGPWAIFGTTYELSGPVPAPYAVTLAGERSGYTAGEYARLELEPIRNPVSGADVHPRLLLPEGLIVKEAALLSARFFSVSDGIAFDYSDRYGALGPFEYEG